MKSVTSTVIFLFLIVAVFAVGSSSAQSCSSDSDGEIVQSILDQIKGNKNLASQMNHINVVSNDRVVKIQGWVKNQSDFDKVQDYAIETRCVRLVNVNSFEASEPEGLLSGCSGGTKPCGDICIPDNDICSIGKTRF